VSCRAYATLMLMLSVCLSVTLMDCDHTVQQKVQIGTHDRLAGRASYPGYGKCGVLLFGVIQRLVCRAISASVHLLVFELLISSTNDGRTGR